MDQEASCSNQNAQKPRRVRNANRKKNAPSKSADIAQSATSKGQNEQVQTEDGNVGDKPQVKKRTRVRNRPNMKQFLLNNAESTKFSLNNVQPINGQITSGEDALKHYKGVKDDPLKLQALYFQMNKLTLNKSSPAKNKTPSKDASNKKDVNRTYEKYIAKEDAMKGLQDGSLIEGSLRINPKCFQRAYISHPDKKQSDIIINGFRNRNRALEDDIVIVQLLDEEDAKVVYIKEHVHPHVSTGTLKLVENSDKQPGATFFPRDKKFPNLFIPLIDCPPNFQLEHKQYENSLFSVRIIKWVHPKHTVGTILNHIGQRNDLKAQTQAILIENGLNHLPYGSEYRDLYPGDDFIIPDEEIAKREDFRDICVFTIDPASARDLDDAVSCKTLDNGNYEIGVHISDVTYYLTEGTALDHEVAKRATTIYLVDGTYHMLPKELCLHCSLLPGTDKLTFSVLWEISPDGEVKSHRFTRGIINSCCQLAYEHVQYMIDNPDKELNEQDYPSILGQWSLADVRKSVDVYHSLASKFRAERFKGGALRIDQPKIWFKLNPTDGCPLTFKIEEHNESHRLIEEFMLLANTTVAERIFNDFPQLAFLRLHPPPKNTLDSVVENFAKLGIDLDVSSAGQLHSSLAKHLADENQCKVFVLQAHLIKTLSRAKYFCANGYDDDEIRHYALNIPLYTHFTSPIRRYADIVVHRLLAASVGYIPRSSKWSPSVIQKIADNCNKQKYNAKRANDMSCELYLFKYIGMYSPLRERAAIMEIFDNAFDVIIFASGLVRRVYFDNFAEVKTQVDVVRSIEHPCKVVVKWETEPQVIQTFSVFSEINVILEKTDNLLVINTRVVKP